MTSGPLLRLEPAYDFLRDDPDFIAIRQELEDLALDIEGLEQEKASLESQETCMRNLDKFSAASETENET